MDEIHGIRKEESVVKSILYGRFIVSIIILLSLSWITINAQSKVTFESLYSFDYITDVKLSPDAAQLAIVSRLGDVEANQSKYSIYIMNVDGGNLKLAAEKVHYSTNLTWVSDTEIAYKGWTQSGSQVVKANIITGDKTVVTSIPQGVGDFVWSPTGKGLALVTDVYPEDNSFEYYEKREKEKSEKKHSGLLYDKLLFRPYYKYDDGTITHLFYQDLTSGKLTDVTPGKDCAPSSHLNGAKDIAFSSDGKSVAFTMNTDPVKALSTNNDVFVVNIDGTKRKRITTSKGNDNDPRFSPDGKYLFYHQMARELYESDQRDIILVDLKTDERINLTKDFDRTLRETFWSKDSEKIFFTCGDKAKNALYQIEIGNGNITKLVDGESFENVNIDEEKGIVYLTMSRVNKPGEVYSYNLGDKEYTQLTHFADEFVDKYQLSESETFWYEGGQGDMVHGFITYPVDYDPAKKYPMVMLFHGGPEGAWSESFSNYGWNDQLMAANGYFVVKINPHGSSSFGMKFQEDLLGKWGVIDIEDVLKGLDFVLAKYPSIDPERVGGLGRSYGGFLVNMLNGKTDRFKCFVSVDGEVDQVMGYYATDELWFPHTEFKGSPLDSPEIYKQSSPITFAANFKTPALILHGGRDYRVDLSQGIAMHTALQLNNVPSQILIFPDEGHYYLKLQTWKYAYEVQFEWLERWLKN
ncbi:MAG: S9 family peptidase [Bacteroidetes bacterium]|nr:S9 family peptidase [Bacteroidota bacterium]